jgi:hypothetical protein
MEITPAPRKPDGVYALDEHRRHENPAGIPEGTTGGIIGETGVPGSRRCSTLRSPIRC